ncbi:MAG: NAD(P)H-binding protein [Pseudomonadota bacterium]
MTEQVLILGAKGRFGRAASEAFSAAGWRVRAFARNWPQDAARFGAELITGDAFDAEAVVSAAADCDVIVNALNPPYPRWKRDVPRLTANVIAAAKTSGAAVFLPGNVYNYGAGMPEVLTEDTPHKPTARKGRLREEMEEAYAVAADAGVRTVIVRAGDFLEREKTGNWFDTHIAAKAGRGRATYPGPRDRVHAWAYLPDLARAMAELARLRAEFAMFETFGFEGYSLTGDALIAAMEETLGRPLKVGGMPWPLIRALGLFSPQMREVAEMAYLWRVPHRIDGAKLAAALPDYRPTPLAEAMADALADHIAEPEPLEGATAAM